MENVLEKRELFDPVLVTDLITKVKGRSSLAKMSGMTPMPFNGTKEFIFNMDSEVDIVAESGKKTPGNLTLEPEIITPIKIEYGARVSDEFTHAAEEEQIAILTAFNDGFAKKAAKGLDLMAMHGINPRTKAVSNVIQDKCFDSKVTQTVNFTKEDPDTNVEAAISMLTAAEADHNGMIMSPAFGGALAAMKIDGRKQFPELSWGVNPGGINGLTTDINSTVSANDNEDRALIGDFEMFKWGYAKQIILTIIPYGDPDNTGHDLKGYNQIYLRAEAYLGWGILDPTAFVRIIAGEETGA